MKRGMRMKKFSVIVAAAAALTLVGCDDGNADAEMATEASEPETVASEAAATMESSDVVAPAGEAPAADESAMTEAAGDDQLDPTGNPIRPDE